ncbi:MAG: baseplate assembly protein [Acidocella sp. 20-57-95]|nr:MAG: baseplate assembly protein [Acidocella sp. 20-57-95]HQT63917.1 phage baseplate assembly protein V [Acidocella sp.]
MDHFWNAVKAKAGGLDALAGVVRFGLVSSFDPAHYAARVLIQPENVLSGWLPILSSWVGAGWGLAAPLTPGDQVLVLAQEADSEHGVIAGCVWSSVDRPIPAPSGELWLQHQTGSFLKLRNDGTITMQAPTVMVTGNLVVTGDISDQNNTHGTLAALRNAHNTHDHLDTQGGVTGLPSVTV